MTTLQALLEQWEARSKDALPTDAMLINKHIRELRTALAQQGDQVPQEWTNLLAYVLQDDMQNRLTPRVIDIAYTAFQLGKQPNKEDGGSSDWFTDTKPTVIGLIAKLRKDLIEEFAAPAPQAQERMTFVQLGGCPFCGKPNCVAGSCRSPAPQAAQPSECKNGCPPMQICDYCQGPCGKDKQAPQSQEQAIKEAFAAGMRCRPASAQPAQRPQNCGTGYCSCIECLLEPAPQPAQGEQIDRSDAVNLARNVINESWTNEDLTTRGVCLLADAVLLMDAALQSAQPVAAWTDGKGYVTTSKTIAEHHAANGEPMTPIAPPVAAPPLTDEQIWFLWASENGLEDCDMCKMDDFKQVFRYVEKAHGITEKGGAA